MDILIKNGRIVDPAAKVNGMGSIGISGNKILDDVGTTDTAGCVIDAKGYYVFPGLIDFHAHIYNGGSGFGVAPDLLIPTGVTTVVDAGSVGCANFEAFYRSVVANSQIRIKTHLSLYAGGQPAYGTVEDFSPESFQKREIFALFEKYDRDIIGLKIRMDKAAVAKYGIKALKAAVDFGKELNCPVVAHASNPPCSAPEIADLLRKDDVFCHCYHGKGPTILDENKKVLKEIKEARQRGVMFDSCNGRTNFSTDVAKAAVVDGFLPDVISTDEAPNVFNKEGFAKNLPYIMSKHLALGMTIDEVVKATTETPARLIGMAGKVGTLRTGAFADVTICKVVHTKVLYLDNLGKTFEGDMLLVPQMTILDGQVLFRQTDF